jgi:hypothetical protein
VTRIAAFSLVAVCACATPPAATGEWLAIAAARGDAAEAVRLAQTIRREWREATVLLSADCAGFRPGLYLVVLRSRSEASAGADTARLKGKFSDAYRRECQPVAGSALAAGVPAVDESIFSVPEDVVNWDGSDMVSTVRSQGDAAIWIRRWYDPVREDPLEGRRVSVLLKRPGSDARELLQRCSGAATVFGNGRVAVTCQTTVAGNDLLHTVHVFDVQSGKQIQTMDRCRSPKFDAAGNVACEPESGRPR